MIQVGQIIERIDRVFRVEALHVNPYDHTLDSVTAECLTPHEDDESVWWSIEISDEGLIVTHTVH